MRIRKNAKLSSLLFSSMASVPEVLQTNVCQLNQSPWDVIPFGQDATQLEADDSFTGNGSLGDSIGAVESVASMMEGSVKLSNNIVITNENEEDKDGICEALDENGIGFEKLVGKDISGDDDGWNFTKQTKGDHSLFSCDQRRPLLRSCDIAAGESNYYSTTQVSFANYPISKKSAAAPAAGTSTSRRTRPSRASKKATGAAAAGGSNPYEFYYYSGFGPLWGKKRRDRGAEDSGNCKIEGKSIENINGIQSNTTTPSSSQIDNDEFDYLDDEEEEEEEEAEGDGDSGKPKRMRKPVKARSLKSLM